MVAVVTLGMILAPMAVGFGVFALQNMYSNKKRGAVSEANKLRLCK